MGHVTTWFQEAVIYEVHVRAFYDRDGNGVGDFAGLADKLPYLEDLGVTALWLLPFCPSPWRDDGYDVCDYTAVHPAYGAIHDFKKFLDACHGRSLRVITEMVLNHTSDEHPWFQRARRAPAGSSERDFYVWSDTPNRYRDARVIFRDFESSNWTWDPVAEAYYWHRFYSHQPDLNYDNPEVRDRVFEAVDFWLDLGVDGLRLDAVPYLYEREGTTCENLPETHALLRRLRAHVDAKYEDRMLLAEANQWPEDAVAYFGAGDECHMAFHFPLMPRLFMANQSEDSFPITNILEQTPAIPDNCQWATFLRNHDELTLEMVCEAERNRMYTAYAHDRQMRINVGIRRRLAPLLGNDRRRIELMNALLLSLPGMPVTYYGDEIGMGDDVSLPDRNSVRTPMQWNNGQNAGFSEAAGSDLYLPLLSDSEYGYQHVNVASQERDPNSLLSWMRRAISLRRRSAALTHGRLRFLHPANRHVLAFIRESEEESALIVANLSRFAQPVELPLSEYGGVSPVEMAGRTAFSQIDDREYQMTLAPYGFYWFTLPSPRSRFTSDSERTPEIRVGALESVLTWGNRSVLERALFPFLKSENSHQVRKVTAVEIVDLLPLTSRCCLAVADLSFDGGDPERHLAPLSIVDTQPHASAGPCAAVIATVRSECGETAYMSRMLLPAGSSRLLEVVSSEGPISGAVGELRGFRTGPFSAGMLADNWCALPHSHGGEQRNISISFANLYVLKLFRRIDKGSNPDLYLVRHLFERAGFAHVAPAVAHLEYVLPDSAGTAGVVHAYVDSEQDFWSYTTHALGLYFDRVLARREQGLPDVPPHALDVDLAAFAETADDLIGAYLEHARMLGRRTAELHIALARATDDEEVRPMPIDAFHLRSEYHAMVDSARLAMHELRLSLPTFAVGTRENAQAVLQLLPDIESAFKGLLKVAEPGLCTRIHGDFHLGQALFTGQDFVFVDFEGDSTKPLEDRLIRRTPLRDVAGALRSFHYASTSAGLGKIPSLLAGERAPVLMARAARFWYGCVGATFLRAYLATAENRGILPGSWDDLRKMLNVHVLDMALCQLAYELNSRPTWVDVAVAGVLDVATNQLGDSCEPSNSEHKPQ